MMPFRVSESNLDRPFWGLMLVSGRVGMSRILDFAFCAWGEGRGFEISCKVPFKP